MKIRGMPWTYFLIFTALYQVAPPISAQEPKPFSFSLHSGDISSLYQITGEEWRGLERSSFSADRKLLQIGIRMNTSGSIYHPNLLSFRANFNLMGLKTQRRMYSDTEANNSLNNTYDLSLALFKKKALNLEIFALQNFNTADRAFTERYFVTSKRAGIRFNSNLNFLPFSLEAYNTRMISESEIFRERQEKTKNVDFRSTLFEADQTRLDTTLRWKDYSEAVYDIDFRSLDILSNFVHIYGARKQNRANTIFSFNRMSGDFDIQRTQVRTNALHYLKKNIFFNGNHALIWDKSFGRTFNRHIFNGSLNHRLFESLESSLYLGERIEKSNFQSISGFQKKIAFNYIKKIPTGSLQFYYSKYSESAKYSSRIEVSHSMEIYSFGSSDILILNLPGINPETIRLTSPDLSRVYIEDLDYMLYLMGNQINILRLPGGGIESSSEILIHFDSLAYPDYRLVSRFAQMNFRVSFLEYFQVFYLSGSNHYSIFSDYLIPPYEEYEKKTYGSRFLLPYFRAEYTYEKYNSALSEYISKDLRLSAGLRLLKTLSLTSSFSRRNLEYSSGDLFTRYRAITLEGSFSPGGSLSANAVYRNIRYTTNVFLRNRQSLLFKLQWSFRRLSIQAFYEHFFFGFEGNSRLRDYFSVVLKRIF